MATGTVQPWQQSIIAGQIGGLPLDEILVDVGDSVAKGQPVARFDQETVRIDLAQADAAVVEAEATLDFAREQAERARQLTETHAVSPEHLQQQIASEKSSAARLALAQAKLEAQRLRMRQTEVLAPDDGVISSRTAMVGAVGTLGSELFRMIRQSRLEWHATLPAAHLARIVPGQQVTLRSGVPTPVCGRVRQISPLVDAGTLTGTLYIDLPEPGALRAGMFLSGQIEFGAAPSLHVPETAIVYRDGFQYVMRIDGQRRVQQVKVTTGRRHEKSVEIVHGVTVNDRIVSSGGSFLNEGDHVLVIDGEPAATNEDSSAMTSYMHDGGSS